MPRPKDGYRNKAGERIPATHDPISRFMDQSALKVWAYNQGKAGKSMYERSAIDIGTAVHTMVELDFKGTASNSDIAFYLENTLRDPQDRAMAQASFAAFREWRSRFAVRPIELEAVLDACAMA